MTESRESADRAVPRRLLSAGDAASIIVGIIVGASIFETAPRIAACVDNLAVLVLFWLLGGLVALAGALCFAELGAAWPEAGGMYVYLSLAYSPRLGFLFAWTDLLVLRPGSIGFMAFVFGGYAHGLLPLTSATATGTLLYAVLSIVVLSLVNLLGVRESKWTQNLLTGAKLLGLMAVITVAFISPAASAPPPAPANPTTNYYLGLILVMFAYGGWSDVAYVAAEIREPRRDIFRALLGGLAAVTAVYVAVNLSYARALGFAGLQQSTAVAADTVGAALGNAGRIGISVLVCISALGAIHGQIFTGARMFYALGRDQPILSPLGRWNQTHGTPARALVVQMVATLIPTLSFAFTTDPAERLVTFTTPFWIFIALAAIGLIVLRYRAPDRLRPYRVWGYPLTPLVFCGSSLFLLVAAGIHAVTNHAFEVYVAAGVVAVGAALLPLLRGTAVSRQ